MEGAMKINCPCCAAEHQLPDNSKSWVPIIQTCEYCRYNFFVDKITSDETYTEDPEWRQFLLSTFGKECVFKRQLEDVEDALFIQDVNQNGKYINVVGKALLKQYEQLEEQYSHLVGKCADRQKKTANRGKDT